jgi:hypothetical protein
MALAVCVRAPQLRTRRRPVVKSMPDNVFRHSNTLEKLQSLYSMLSSVDLWLLLVRGVVAGPRPGRAESVGVP